MRRVDADTIAGSSDPLMPPRLRGRSPIDPKAVTSIRWLALAGQTVALLLVYHVLQFDVLILSALGIVLVGICVNLWQVWRLRNPSKIKLSEVVLALHFDVLQLAGLLYLTGGLENPFAMLFLAPIVVSAALLDIKATISLVILVGISAACLLFFHLPLPWYETGFHLPNLYLFGLLSALLVSSVFIGFYVWWLAAEARRTEAALGATQLILAREQQITALGTLAAAAAHKLGSPLNTIALISHELPGQLEKKWAGDKELQEDIALLNAEVERCRIILSELDKDAQMSGKDLAAALPVSQIFQAQLAPHLADMTHKVNITTATLGSRLVLAEGADTSVPREPELLPLPDIKYALETLLDNADDYANNLITLDISWNETHIIVKVADDGPGFRASVMAIVGQPWNSSRQGTGGHRGLGLFLAQTIIEGRGGSLVVSNQKSGGAEIVITMPLARLV
jgi:two-component system sensor histidine kinase RegB